MGSFVVKKQPKSSSPDGRPKLEGYVMPNQTMYYYTENRPSIVGRSILIRCDLFDNGALVFNGPEGGPLIDKTIEDDRTYLDGLCVVENRLRTVPFETETRVTMHDYKEGQLEILIGHVGVWSYN